MQLIGLDIAENFCAAHEHTSWAWEVEALLMELANRKWASASELLRDYPTAQTDSPAVVFSIAGGQVLVSCLILFSQGVVLVKEFILHQVQKRNIKRYASGGSA